MLPRTVSPVRGPVNRPLGPSCVQGVLNVRRGPRWTLWPRVLRTPFVERWRGRPAQAREHAEDLRSQIMGAVTRHRPDEIVPFTGQTAGLIGEVLPAGEIVGRIVTGAEEALERAAELRR